MAAMCDVHPTTPANYHLEGPEGNCYEMCSISEIGALVTHSALINGSKGRLVPCGHVNDYSNECTWPLAIGLLEEKPIADIKQDREKLRLHFVAANAYMEEAIAKLSTYVQQSKIDATMSLSRFRALSNNVVIAATNVRNADLALKHHIRTHLQVKDDAGLLQSETVTP